MSTKYGLEFGKVKSRNTAYGVLSDNKGNTFCLEIRGTNEKDVRRFINYERKQVEAGKGIEVSIEACKDPVPGLLRTTHPKRVRRQVSWQGISIKLKELHVKVERPYKLHFSIDPPIQKGEIRDFPLDNQPMADVNCRVAKGSVKMELFEFTDNVKSSSTLVRSGIFSAGEPQGFIAHPGFHRQSHHTGNWNVRITGLDSANFTLEFDLFVL